MQQSSSNSPYTPVIVSNFNLKSQHSLDADMALSGLRRTNSQDTGRIPKNEVQAKLDMLKRTQEELVQKQKENELLKEEKAMISKQFKDTFIRADGRNLSDAKVHLAFVFATPLVIRKLGVESNNF